MKKLSLLFILTSIVFVSCKSEKEPEKEIKGFYDAMHFSRKGGGNFDFYVYPGDSSDRLEISLKQVDFKDTLLNYILFKNKDNADAFSKLHDAMNNVTRLNGDFKQSELETGSWLHIYFVKDSIETEVTNEALREEMSDFSAFLQQGMQNDYPSKLIRVVHVDSLYIDESEVNSNAYKEYKADSALELQVQLLTKLDTVILPAYCGRFKFDMTFAYKVIKVIKGRYNADTIYINHDCPRELVEGKDLENGKTYTYKLKRRFITTYYGKGDKKKTIDEGDYEIY